MNALRLVHSLEPLNRITIRHSGMPPIPDHLAEQFAGLACGAMFNLYVGYDERLIAESSRDYTTFQTPYGGGPFALSPYPWDGRTQYQSFMTMSLTFSNPKSPPLPYPT
jgi:hypothetical protein